MVARLEPPDEKENRDPRGELDRNLEVGSWRVPGWDGLARELPDGAPAWWRGDEEASQSFLRAMGVQLEG